jgi:hypothetical protein
VSEPTDDRTSGQDALDRALDVLVFAPTELFLEALTEGPDLAQRGRERIAAPVRNAVALGRLTVAFARRDLEGRVERFLAAPWPGPRGARPPAQEPPVSTSVPEEPADDPGGAPDAPVDAVTPAGGSDGGVDLAIPGYDTLSASQVVRRLEGLGAGELDAVYEYELATRGRRTILHRARQLLGIEPPPGPPLGDEAGGETEG